MVLILVVFYSGTPTRGIDLSGFFYSGTQHVAGNSGIGRVQSQRPAEPHQDGEGHGSAQVVRRERNQRGPPPNPVLHTINFVIFFYHFGS